MPPIIPAFKHHISSKKVNKNAIKIIKHLQRAGFEAYLVGGGVRDLLLGLSPKDFDIATSASPNQVKKLFKNCRLIGRRFRLAHLYFRQEIIEVATFRGSHEGAEPHQAHTHHTGVILRDNVYGTLAEDAQRRDFTINALYYDPISGKLLNFFHGFEDIKQKTIRVIGDATTRYKEDPVRMLRAIRFMGKLKFQMDPKTSAPITQLTKLLQNISSARLYDELLKLFHSGFISNTFDPLRQFHLFKILFPDTDALLSDKNTEQLLRRLYKNTDQRIKIGKPVSPAFLFAVLLWPPLNHLITKHRRSGYTAALAYYEASKTILHDQNQVIMIPRRIRPGIQDIWSLQRRLERRQPKYINRILALPKFRAAYDLLLLRAETNKKLQPIAKWWTKIQTANQQETQQMIQNLSHQTKSRRRKFRSKAT